MLQLALFPICQARVSRFYLNFPLFLILRPSPRQVAKIISQRASFLASTSLPAFLAYPRQNVRTCQNIGHIECKIKCRGLLIGVDWDRGNELTSMVVHLWTTSRGSRQFRFSMDCLEVEDRGSDSRWDPHEFFCQ